jgi:hypothetical protein
MSYMLKMEGETPCNYTTYPDNVPTTTASSSDQNTIESNVNHLVVILLFCITFLINFIICIPSFVHRRRRQRHWDARIAVRITSARGSHEDGEENMSPEEVQRIKAARYNIIENWIVSKQIHEHDDLCSKCMPLATLNASTPTSIEISCSSAETPTKQKTRVVKTASTVDMTDEEWGEGMGDDGDEEEGGNECPICFEELQVGDVVSWSPESSHTCKHIFHHACIKEWLLKNSGCPFCRATVLPIDRLVPRCDGRHNHQFSAGAGLQQIGQLLQAQEQHKEAQHECFYCIDHGIVRLPNIVPKSTRGYCGMAPDVMEEATGRARDVPSKQVLVEMRCGNRNATHSGEIAKQLPPATEGSVTISTMTVQESDDDQRDVESSPDSSSYSSDTSSPISTDEIVLPASSSSTRRLAVVQGDCDDDGREYYVDQQQQTAENTAVSLKADNDSSL